MDSGTSSWVLMLHILMLLVTFSNEKAVPEDSITGYEYSYNKRNGQYELRPLYGKQILLTSTLTPKHHNPQSEFYENDGKPIFLPPIGKPKSEMNEILRDYYGSRSKLNQQLKGMEISRDYSNNLDFTQNWSPDYSTNDGNGNGYFENPIISSSKNSHDRLFQNKKSCKNCQGESVSEKSERYKTQPHVEYEEGSKLQSNLNNGMDQLRRKDDKIIYSQTVPSAISTDHVDKPTYEFEEVKVVNKIKSKDKSALTETTSEKYYTPAIQVTLHKSGSKGNKKIKKHKNYMEFIKNSESDKPVNEHPKSVSTMTIHTAESPEYKETKTIILPEKSKDYNTAKTIPVEKTKSWEDHEYDYFTKVKDAHSNSFTKKKKECKDIKFKSNKDGNVKSCSEDSNSSEPEIEESPKTVSIGTSSVKSPVTDEYGLKNKDYDADAIPVEETKHSEDHEYDYFTKVKDAHSSSFTKKKKGCKDTKLKSNKDSNVKSCSEDSNWSEPEMEESPKTVSSVKSPVTDEYGLKNKDNTADAIPVGETKHSEDHEYDYFTKVKDAHSSSFTKKKKECKDIKFKSNKDGNVKSCSEDSNSSESEIEEFPKTVYIGTSGVKSPVTNEYGLKNKGNKDNLKYLSVTEDISKGIDLMDIGESRADFRRGISDCNEKFIELINSGDMETNQLSGQCPENIASKIVTDVPNFSEVDNKFKSFSFLNSNLWSLISNPNLWSLISNPNAKDLSLQKCITRKNESGHCMYIQNCPVPNIANSLEQLLDNACVMDEVFIGICCPEFPVQTVKVHWEQLERNPSDKLIEDEFRHDVEGCGKRSEEASKKNLWPWKAPLVSMSNGKIFCGGVIISERYVLTAAHCTTKIAKNQILVRLGKDHESLGEDIPVTEIKRHAQYNPRTMQHDIALLKLDERLSRAFKEGASIICLPEESDSTDSHAGDKAILLGWQGLSGVNPHEAETLQILSNEECRKKFNANVHQSLLCTEVRNEDERTCNADSGSPLVVEGDDDQEYEVVGILSWNRNDCDPRFPSTFSKVSSYREWIRRHAV